MEVRLPVAPLLDLDDAGVREAYFEYMDAARRASERAVAPIIEVIDLSGCTMTALTVRRLPLLLELVRTGQAKYGHTLKTVIVNAPYGVSSALETVLGVLPSLRSRQIEFRSE